MSKESYAIGFCKAVESAGVDPVALAKYAQQNRLGLPSVGPTIVNAITDEVFSGVKKNPAHVDDTLVKVPVASPHIKRYIGQGIGKHLIANPAAFRKYTTGVGLKDIMDLGAKYSPTFRRIMSNK